ncbi:MAG: hypothetical protein KIT84_19080 [Labilithrix sp.]|nr:hypothetical protein [Labilithrix sp.]MCW5813139.1 hypothetical protein [Labilithrix sp.]
MSTEVPVELRGREATVRFLAPLFEAAARKGSSADAIAEGTGCSAAELRDPRARISWPAFTRVLSSFGRVLSDEELVRAGAAVLETPVARALMLPGRLLFSLVDLYRWGARPDAPVAQMMAVADMSVTQLGERRLRFDVQMKPGYTAVREFWLVRLGVIRGVPRAFGLPPATVTYEATETAASYLIELPEERGLASRARKRVSWIVAARAAAAELQRANDDLHARYLELQREVERRKAAEEQLRAELTLFSASVAHDFRAPLRAINGLAKGVIEDHGDRLDAHVKRELGRVIASAVHMGELIDALLSLSRITRQEMRQERVDVSDAARAVLQDLYSAEPERQVEATVADGIVLDGDAALVRTLMECLLGNAWKFSRHRAPAHITVARDGDAVCVRDDGAGFDMQHLGAIFAPFHRLHTAKEFEGIGIGLAIADRIVRRHGGTLAVTTAPGEGAAFTFTLGPR